jgi:toxin ParE1/3/4
VAKLQFARRAKRDIGALLDWSEERFGPLARRRYEALIDAALQDIANDASRAGSTGLIILGRRVRLYHLRHSRNRARVDEGVVQSPRHVVVYRLAPHDTVIILRVLHDSMDLTRHLDARRQ